MLSKWWTITVNILLFSHHHCTPNGCVFIIPIFSRALKSVSLKAVMTATAGYGWSVTAILPVASRWFVNLFTGRNLRWNISAKNPTRSGCRIHSATVPTSLKSWRGAMSNIFQQQKLLGTKSINSPIILSAGLALTVRVCWRTSPCLLIRLMSMSL